MQRSLSHMKPSISRVQRCPFSWRAIMSGRLMSAIKQGMKTLKLTIANTNYRFNGKRKTGNEKRTFFLAQTGAGSLDM